MYVRVGRNVNRRITSDPPGATFSASGLPNYLRLSSDGWLTGYVNRWGDSHVTVIAETTAAGFTTSQRSFYVSAYDDWNGWGSGASVSCASGAGGLAVLGAAALLLVRRRRKA